MAEHLTHTYSDTPPTPAQKAEDFREHDSTYTAFIRMAKWTIGIVVVILVLLYVFLVA